MGSLDIINSTWMDRNRCEKQLSLFDIIDKQAAAIAQGFRCISNNEKTAALHRKSLNDSPIVLLPFLLDPRVLVHFADNSKSGEAREFMAPKLRE